MIAFSRPRTIWTPAGPTIAFRSLTSVAYGAGHTNTVLSAPAGLADGDILIAAIVTALASSAPTPTPPAGFAAFGTETSVSDGGGFNGRLNVFWKRAAGESGSYTFTHATCSSNAVLKAYSGCKASGTPLGATSNNTGTYPGASTGTGITTTAANSWLLYEAHDWTGSGVLTPPTGMTERYDGLLYSADQLIAAAGTTGDRTQTNGNGSAADRWAVRMIELLAGSASDPDVAAWAAAVVTNGGTVSASRIALVSTMVAAWKASGIYPLIDDVLLLVGENEPQALTSLKQRILATAVNAPTFTVDRGYALNGTTQYINTNFIPTTHAVAMTGSDIRFALYERTNVATATYAGASMSSTRQITLSPRINTNMIVFGLNANGGTYPASTDSRGLTAVSRTAGSVYTAYRAGVSAGTVTPTGTAAVLPNIALYIGAYNNNGAAAGFRAATEGFMTVGASLSAAQELAFHDALQAFMVATGANV